MNSQRRRLATFISIAAVAALWSAAGAAAARTLTVSGTLDRPGFTVVALGYNGRAVFSSARSFKLPVPDRLVTLQLVDGHGKYAGPVILGGTASRLLVGTKGGVALGLIRVMPGYARTVRPAPAAFVDRRRLVFAHRGVPIGTGRNFGLARSNGHGRPGPGLDQDQDGVPDSFDVNVTGDGVLNPLEPAAAGATSAAGAAPVFGWASQLVLDVSQTVNADSAAVTPAAIDATLAGHLTLTGTPVPAGDLVELDCGGLRYCSPGGSGRLVVGAAPNSSTTAFPSCCDSDQNGFGNVRGPGALPLGTGPAGDVLTLLPGASSAQIGSGDTMFMRVTSGGAVTITPAPIDFVPDTVPALAAYADGAGDAGAISYPAAAGSPGTLENPLALAAGPSNGDVVLRSTFWRPQRRGIVGAGEPRFMDVGRLAYSFDIVGGAPARCSAASVTTADPLLTEKAVQGASGGQAAVLVDSAADSPANPANTLTATLDLTRCLAGKGISSFPVGSTVEVELGSAAQSSADSATQQIWVRRTR